MADYGIKISLPGSDAVSGSGPDLGFNTEYPFAKIDTQNNAGFQTITMLITNDPPEPASGSLYAYTQLYKFKHGYSYVPSFEHLMYLQSPPPGPPPKYQQYALDIMLLSAHSPYDQAVLWPLVDDTYVYFVVQKFYDNSVGLAKHNLLSGTTIQITSHIFVDDIGGV
jgi:hypothetical protein